MDFKIEVLENCQIVYMRNIGPYGSEDNFAMMTKFKEWISIHHLNNEKNNFGIWGMALDDPQETESEKCRYDLALRIPSGKRVGSDMKTADFEGGPYAVFTVPHTTEAVQNFWVKLKETIQNERLTLREKPIIERFKEEVGVDNTCDFLVPIHYVK